MCYSDSSVEDSEIHLIYLRYAFTLPDEPGPKRPIEIVKRYSRQGHRVSVITTNCNFMTGEIIDKKAGRFSTKIVDGIEYVRAAAIPDHRRSTVKRLLNYALFTWLGLQAGLKLCSRKDNKVVIYVDISPPFAALGGYLLGRLRRNARLILEITDLPESVFAVGMFDIFYIRWLTGQLFKHIYKSADGIVALTPGAKRHIAELGISEERIEVVTNWVDTTRFGAKENRLRDTTRQQLNWQDCFVVMYAGGHGQAYDLMTLMQAAEILRDVSNLKIVFMGSGERKAEYMKYCEERNLSLCQFLSPVSHKRLNAYLLAADVCVNLFYKKEFWRKVVGHKIVDYFQAGRPIIFGGEGDTADIIRRANGGVVVPPENPIALSEAILEVMKDRSKVRKMGKQGRKYLIREFAKDRVLGKLDVLLLGNDTGVASRQSSC